jgi:hypothetical protein
VRVDERENALGAPIQILQKVVSVMTFLRPRLFQVLLHVAVRIIIVLLFVIRAEIDELHAKQRYLLLDGAFS